MAEGRKQGSHCIKGVTWSSLGNTRVTCVTERRRLPPATEASHEIVAGIAMRHGTFNEGTMLRHMLVSVAWRGKRLRPPSSRISMPLIRELACSCNAREVWSTAWMRTGSPSDERGSIRLLSAYRYRPRGCASHSRLPGCIPGSSWAAGFMLDPRKGRKAG